MMVNNPSFGQDVSRYIVSMKGTVLGPINTVWQKSKHKCELLKRKIGTIDTWKKLAALRAAIYIPKIQQILQSTKTLKILLYT